MLTPKQEKFCQGIVDGKSQVEAYKDAYNTAKMADKTVYETASRLMRDRNISARIEELRGKIEDSMIMSAKERARWLTDAINQLGVSMPDKLKALDILNKMTGEYVQKVEASVAQEIEVNINLSDD